MKPFKWCFLIALFNYSFAQESSDSLKIENRLMDEKGFYVKIGDTIPNITFVLDDESIVTINDLKRKVVLLQFTASWCGVCREEMPYIENDLWKSTKTKGYMLLELIVTSHFQRFRNLKSS